VKPRLLDLFCGAGGCSVGYARAGFDVVGVDINPQKNYPFEFVQADATEYPLDGFDAIHASPPCQDHMQTPHRKHGTGWMLPHTRDRLLEQFSPWVIENVPGAPMRPDIKICGCQVGLELRRERWFETSWEAFSLAEPHHHPHPVVSVVGHGTPTWVREKLGFNPTIAHYRAAMGIDWMNRDELSQAIPPAYTELIGHQLMQHIRAAAA
jgi:DNA (cytosine-5)-methyltransferase 1